MENRILADVPGSWAPVFTGSQEDVDFLVEQGYIVLDAVLRFDWGQNVTYYRRPDMAPRLHNHFALVETGPALAGREAGHVHKEVPEIEDEPEWEIGDRVRVIFWGEPGTTDSRQYEGKEGTVVDLNAYVLVDLGDGKGNLPCRAVELEHVVPEVEKERINYKREDFKVGDRIFVDNWLGKGINWTGNIGTIISDSFFIKVRVDVKDSRLSAGNVLHCTPDEIRPLTSADFKPGMTVEGVKWEDGATRFTSLVVGKYGTVVEDDDVDPKYVSVEFAGIEYGLPMTLDEIRLVKE